MLFAQGGELLHDWHDLLWVTIGDHFPVKNQHILLLFLCGWIAIHKIAKNVGPESIG